MPTAEKFNALGSGNGFPFCFPTSENPSFNFKLDVSSESNVNPLTLEQAMKIYWLAFKFNCNTKASITGLGSFDGNAIQTEIQCWSFGEFQTLEPYFRTCFNKVVRVRGTTQLEQVVASNFSFAIPDLDFSYLSLLYNGDVTNEENFLGYGFKGRSTTDNDGIPFYGTEARNNRFGGTRAVYELASYMTGSDLDIDPDGRIVRHGSTTILVDGEEIPFAYRSEARPSGLSGATDISATANADGASVVESGNNQSISASVEKPSLELYAFS